MLSAESGRKKIKMRYKNRERLYVEPVLTVHEHRRQGLAKAVIYEACARAKALGAKRAIVVSEQEFYFRIGFTLSSEVYDWTRKIGIIMHLDSSFKHVSCLHIDNEINS